MRYPRVFSDMAVNISGRERRWLLEDALERVSFFTEQQEDIKGRAIGALAYPIFLAVVGFGVVTVLIVFFVPKFEPLFDGLRAAGELPMATDLLLGISGLLQSYWWLLLGVVVFAALGLTQFLQGDSGKYWMDMVKIKVPLFGSIFLNLSVARFCRVLGTLLGNGATILKSLDSSSRAAGNRILAESIMKASENITAVPTSVSAGGLRLPQKWSEMITVAEESIAEGS